MIEKKDVKLGYVSLTDSLPLLAASEQGFFESEGLNVQLSNEASWANIRDKTILGELDGAQMLAPMPLASTLGLSGIAKPMLTMFSLSLNGNGITVSNELWSQLSETASSPEPLDVARAMVELVEKRGRQLTLATVFPTSMHSYLLRYWLAAGGLERWDRVKIVVVPPIQMVSHMRLGHIDGFCVGEPWNTVAGLSGVGRPLITGYEIWQNAPEKVFGVTEAWARENPSTHRAIVRSLARAAAWIEAEPTAAAEILDNRLDRGAGMSPLPESKWGLDRTYRDETHFHVFHHYAANFPWRSHGAWMLSQMQRWGQVVDPVPKDVVDRVYRFDMYREVFGESELPNANEKTEGLHGEAWSEMGVLLGPDKFVDGARFDV